MAMIQRPDSVGLILCRMVIVEEKTHNVTLANSFSRLGVGAFPSTPVPLYVFTALRDGLGQFSLTMAVTQCDTLDEIYAKEFSVSFDDPLRQLRLYWMIRSCSFPAPGGYAFSLWADGEMITQSVLQVRGE